MRIDFGYCGPRRFQTRGPKVQKWMFLFFVQEDLNFNLILIVVFVISSSAKSLSEKCIVLCNYYRCFFLHIMEVFSSLKKKKFSFITFLFTIAVWSKKLSTLAFNFISKIPFREMHSGM